MKRFHGVKRGLAILLCACMTSGMVPVQASAEEAATENLPQEEIQQEEVPQEESNISLQSNGISTYAAEMDTSPVYQKMQPGSTLDVTTVPMGTLIPRVYQLDEEGATYTITGDRESSSSTTLRFVISANCTVILDNATFTAGISYDDGTKNVYSGGAGKSHGVFEVEEGKKAVFQIEGRNNIYPENYNSYHKYDDLLGILLKKDAQVEFKGTGSLDLYGRIGMNIENSNGKPVIFGRGTVIMKSGTVSVTGFGNTDYSGDTGYFSPKGTIVFNYEGGNFENKLDFINSYDHSYTSSNASGMIYRVEIPTTKGTDGKIKIGSSGSFTAYKALHEGKVYAWQESTAQKDYYLFYNGTYHHFKSGEYADGTYTAQAVDVTSDRESIGGFSGKVKVRENAVENAELTFSRADSDGISFTGTCTTDSNGDYYIALPPGTYTVKVKCSSGELNYGETFTLSEEKEEKNKDINLSEIYGTVKDYDNKPLSNVSVTFTQGDMRYLVKTDSNGYYAVIPDGFKDNETFTAEASILSVEPVLESLTWNASSGVNWDVQIDASKLSSTVYVYTEQDLVRLAENATQLNGKTIEIMDDISLSGEFTGIQIPDNIAQSGIKIVLKGNHHTIQNLNSPIFIGWDINYSCLNGTVSDLHLKGDINSSSNYAGALASLTKHCTISNCSFEGNITGKKSRGGLIGYAEDTTIKNCKVILNSVSVTPGEAAGGICGEVDNSYIYNSYAIIKAMSYSVDYSEYKTAAGGIAGDVHKSSKGEIKNCYVVVDKVSGSKPFPMMGYYSDYKDYLANITFSDNYSCGGTDIFAIPDSAQATDISKAVVSAESGTTEGGQKALVDCLNEYVSANPNKGYKNWELGADGYPDFLSLDAVNAADVTVTYDGKPHSITVNGVPDGAIVTYSTDGINYSGTNPEFTNVADSGTVYYKVTYKGELAEKSARVTIDKKELTVQAADKKVSYGDSAPDYTAAYTGLATSDNTVQFKNRLMISCDYQQGSDKGTYDIIPSGLPDANYNITYKKGILTVDAKEIGITWGTTNFDYNGMKQVPMAAAAGMLSKDTLTLTVVSDSGNATDAGTHTAKVTEIKGIGAGNYKLPSAVTKSYTINPASLSGADITVIGEDSLIYTGTEQKPEITVTLDGKTLTETTDYTAAYKDNINAATEETKAEVTITGTGNYKGTAAEKFVIKKRPLTITADDKAVMYGEEPAFTVTYAGFVNGESETKDGVLAGTLTFTCDDRNAGTHPIIPGGLTSRNYELAYVNGILTVGRLDGNVTMDAVSEKTYGDADFALSVDKHGSDGMLTFTSSDTNVLTVDNTGMVTMKNTGTATITVDMAEGTNYKAAQNTVTIIVVKKAAKLEVSKLAYTAVYGDADIDLGLKSEGESAITATTTDDKVADIVDGKLHIVGAGDATITLSIAESRNYLAKDVTFSVTVKPALLTIQAEDKTIDYDADAPAFTAKYEGLKNSDTAEKDGVFTGTLGFDCSYRKGDDTNGKAGTYDIVPSGLQSRNYIITYMNGTLTVKEKKPENNPGNNNNPDNNNNSGNNNNSTGSSNNSSDNNSAGNNGRQDADNTDQQADSGKADEKNTVADTGSKPYIRDDSGKEGWDAILPQLEEADSGETVTVDMNGTTVVPKNVIDSIKGEDVTLVLDMGNGITWRINGNDVTEASGDIDFGITMGKEAGKSIPVDVINNVTGERYSMNLTLAYSGEFGFKATLTINMEAKNAGLYANLFYYNETAGELEFVSAGQIDADGNVELNFTHASDYTIVIDANVMNGENEESIASEESTGEEKNTDLGQTDEKKDDSWNPLIFIIIGIVVILLAAGIVIYKRKKK